jgi:hypothetical protein
LFQNDLTADIADDGAVFGRYIIDMVCRKNAAGAGHIVDQDIRISRNVLMQVAADETGISVVAAAGGKSDNDAHRLALIKIRYRFLVEGGFGSGRPSLHHRSSK